MKERLPDKLAVTLYFDPETKTLSGPDEGSETFASRLGAEGGKARRAKLEERLAKKRQELAIREQEMAGRRTEKWAALGSAVLSNLGLLRGRKRTISGVGSVLSKNRLENAAEAKVEAQRAEIQGLELELAALADVDPERFERKEVVPGKSDLTVLRREIVWVY